MATAPCGEDRGQGSPGDSGGPYPTSLPSLPHFPGQKGTARTLPPTQRLQISEEQISGALQSGKERGSRESRGAPETRARRRPLSLPVPFPRPHLPSPPGRGWGTRSPLSHRLLRPVPSCSHLLLSYNHPLIPGAHSQGVRRPARPQQSLLLLPPTSAPRAPPTQSRRPLPTSLGGGDGEGSPRGWPTLPWTPFYPASSSRFSPALGALLGAWIFLYFPCSSLTLPLSIPLCHLPIFVCSQTLAGLHLCVCFPLNLSESIST